MLLESSTARPWPGSTALGASGFGSSPLIGQRRKRDQRAS
jgi:hypothetical protein